MAELKEEEEEHALPAKRKSDLLVEGKDIDGSESTTKKQKSEEEEEEDNSSVAEEKKVIDEDVEDEEDEEDFGGEDDDDDDDEEEEEESEDGEHSNGEAQIDRKGKGIMKEDKGKGKLIEESDESSDAGESESEDIDSDLSDDPLAEVDLSNILPSRTRRRVTRPGISIADDLVPKDSDDTNA